MAYVTGATGGSVGTPGRMVMPHFDPSVLNIDTVGIMSKGFELGKRMYNARQDREDELKQRAAQIKAAEAGADAAALKQKEAELTHTNRVKSINADATLDAAVKARLLEQEKKNYDNYVAAATSAAEAEAILKRGAAAQAPYVAETNVLVAKQGLERQPGVGTELANTQRIRTQASEQMTPGKPYSGTPAPGMSVVGVPGKDGVSFEPVRSPAGILNQGTGETRAVPVTNADGSQATDKDGNPLYRVQAQTVGGWTDKGSIAGTQAGSTASQVLANVPTAAPTARVPNPLAPKAAEGSAPATPAEQAAYEPVKTAAETLQPEVFSPQASLRKPQQTSFVKSWEKKEENLGKELEATSALRDVIRNAKAVAETAHVGIANRVESLLPVQIQQDDKVVLDKLTNQLTTSTLKSTFGSRITNMDIEQQAKVNPNGTMSRGQIMSILNMADAAAERKTQHAEFLSEAKRYGASPLTAENMWAKYVDAVPVIAKNSDTGVWEEVKAPSIDEWINTPKKKEEKPSASTSGTPEAKKSGRFTIESVE